jgi:hypothetical protein
MIAFAQTDPHSSGFGFDWGQTRTWTNGPDYATRSDNGSGWVDTYTPHLMQADGQTSNMLLLLTNGETASLGSPTDAPVASHADNAFP